MHLENLACVGCRFLTFFVDAKKRAWSVFDWSPLRYAPLFFSFIFFHCSSLTANSRHFHPPPMPPWLVNVFLWHLCELRFQYYHVPILSAILVKPSGIVEHLHDCVVNFFQKIAMRHSSVFTSFWDEIHMLYLLVRELVIQKVKQVSARGMWLCRFPPEFIFCSKPNLDLFFSIN